MKIGEDHVLNKDFYLVQRCGGLLIHSRQEIALDLAKQISYQNIVILTPRQQYSSFHYYSSSVTLLPHRGAVNTRPVTQAKSVKFVKNGQNSQTWSKMVKHGKICSKIAKDANMAKMFKHDKNGQKTVFLLLFLLLLRHIFDPT